ncbi:MAG TPA: OsmC family peroxiredoxin [Cytophagales bacterium]|nr:OsmC family peroxiredoxin [Cytophagales bacterium]
MAIKRSASANWKGSGKEGKGTLNSTSGVLSNTQYSYNTRFEDGVGTNPEELVAAAHAGCFSMKLAFVLQGAGITADSIDTTATAVLDNGVITEVLLATSVKAAGLTKEQLAAHAQDAKDNCPISKSLTAQISLETTLL